MFSECSNNVDLLLKVFIIEPLEYLYIIEHLLETCKVGKSAGDQLALTARKLSLKSFYSIPNSFKKHDLVRGQPLNIQGGGLGRSGDEKLFISRQKDA